MISKKNLPSPKFFSTRPFLLSAILLFFLCLLAYSNCFRHGFLLDDYTHLLNEDNLEKVTWAELFSKAYKGFYRPFAFMFLKGMLGVFKDAGVAYHVFNLILFYGICLMFYRLWIELFKDQRLALLACSLFAAHPVNAMLVNYKTASNNSIFILCMQMSAWLLVKSMDARKTGYYYASLLFYFLSLLSHEISFILPVYLFLILFLLRDYGGKKSGVSCLSFLVPLTVYLIIRRNIAGLSPMADPFHLGISFIQYVGTLMSLIGWYLQKLVVPVNILFIWDERIAEGGTAVFYAVFLMMVVAVVAGVLYRRRPGDVKTFGAGLLAAGFIPLGLAGFTYSASMKTVIIEPHWFGFSSMGFFLLAAGILINLRKFAHEKIRIPALVILLGTLLLLTRTGNAVWKDEETYCTNWIETNALNGEPWNCLARVYRAKHDQGLNKNRYQDCTEAAYLAFAYHVTGDGTRSLNYYNMALDINRDCPVAYYGLGLLYTIAQDEGSAAWAYDNALRLNPGYYPLVKKLEDVFYNRRKKDAARRIRELFLSESFKGP
ncbi:MAG: hypothetical protein A2Y04_00395 [Omnitrophica WOR_2 bacterium GWC2_45_7]|nr:MAG: hypothetical protein A2Y04_00395 [Omnitrophica WOR_2 bacterium GWC2_45_7]